MIDAKIKELAAQGHTPCAIQDILFKQHRQAVLIDAIRAICRGQAVNAIGISPITCKPDSVATIAALANKLTLLKKQRQASVLDNKKRRDRRKAEGLCYLCGGERDSELTACRPCRTKESIRRSRWNASKYNKNQESVACG